MDLIEDKQKLLEEVEHEEKQEQHEEQQQAKQEEEAQRENIAQELTPYIDLLHKGLFYGVFKFQEVDANYINEANRLLMQIIEKRANFLVKIANKGGVEMAYIGTIATIYMLNEGKKHELQQEQPQQEQQQEGDIKNDE